MKQVKTLPEIDCVGRNWEYWKRGKKTYVIKGKTEPQWAPGGCRWDRVLGRMATPDCLLFVGKSIKPTYTPGVDMGDIVVVLNASKLRFSQKRLENKRYYWHTGYPGGNQIGLI